MTLPDLLQQWQNEGWLRPIDLALAGLLAELSGEGDQTVLALVALTSLHVGAGHVCMDIEALLQTPEIFLPPLKPREEEIAGGWRPFIDALRAEGLPAVLARLQSSPAIASHPRVRLDNGQGEEPLVLDGHRLYLRRYWAYETKVAAALNMRMDSVAISGNAANPGESARQAFNASSDLRASLDTLFGTIDNSHKAANEPPPDWQRIAAAITAQQRFAVISGGPGTGKTTTVVKLLSLLQDMALRSQGRALRIALAAPTGKAAARLTESIGTRVERLPCREHIPTQVTTLHRLLGARPDTREFVRHRGNPLHVDILVIDEASMVDLEMMAAVVDALPPLARLILLGDKDQLASVEAGAILGEICRNAHLARYSPALCARLQVSANITLAPSGDAQRLDDHIITLKKSHRFSSEGGIGRLAQAINDGDVKAALSLLEGVSDVRPPDHPLPEVRWLRNTTLENTVKLLVLDVQCGYAQYLTLVNAGCPDALTPDQWAAQVLEKLGGFQILCAVRQGAYGVEAINDLVTRLLHQAHYLPTVQGWYAGRPVMVTRNDYALGLMNGDVGITLPDRTAGGALRVFFAQPEGIKRVLPSRLTQVDTVFAMTVHKSQGSEFSHTCLILPNTFSPVLTRELIYTAVTRAKQRVTLVGDRQEVLENALRQRVFRCSGLWERLTQG